MPLPQHALVLHGGCNCGAVRYRVEIPENSKRPTNPVSNGDVTFPVVLTDHCNDCRKALGSILPTWICVPAPMMSCILEPIVADSDSPPSGDKAWLPVTNFFYPGPQSEKYWLRFYKSSERTTRSFCGKCGTNLTYSIPNLGQGWPDMFDVVLGTLDKGDLENDWMAPDRHCWVSCEIPWISKLTNGIPSMPRHPSYKLDELAE